MVRSRVSRPWLLVAVSLLLVGGLVGCATYPPKELTAADQALEAARQAGKDKQCPNEFNDAVRVTNEAHAVCRPCHTAEAIAKANQALDMVHALCPVKATPAEPPKAPPPPAPMASLSANPASVVEGKCTNLTWTSSNGSSASINQGVGSVDLNGSRQVCPKGTTQYTISVSGAGGSRDASTTVTVNPRVVDRLTLHVNFDFNKATIKSEEDADLQKAVDFAKKYPAFKISLTGYTDSIGKPEYNQKLSEKRAAAVKDFLVKNGVEASRIETSGKGENDPIADNKTDKGRAENRRVEIQALSE